MRFLFSPFTVLASLSVASAVCTGDATAPGAGGSVPLKGGTPSANAVPLFYTFGQNSGAFTNGIKNGGLGGLAGADFFCNYEADAARGATALIQSRKGLFKAVMSNRLTDAYTRFNAVNENENAGTSTHDVVDANNQCLVDSVGNLFFGSWNFNQVLPDGKGNMADPTAIIDNFTGTKTDFTKWKDTSGGESDTVINNAYCSTSTSPTDEGWSSTTGTTRVGRIFSNTNNAASDWISAVDVGCTNGLHILCMQASPSPTQPGGSGDPQFTGLQGQQFQVHGMPDEYFNLISSPDMQLNSRFAYLASGRCNYNNTECWTHPGTYVDQLGFMFPGINIKTVAGSHRKGLRVWINEEEMKKSSGKVVMTTTTTNTNSSVVGEVSVSHPHHDVLVVSSPLFTIEVTNSDWFFNFNLMFHAPEILASGRMLHYIGDARSGSKYGEKFYPAYPMHGLVGQTWKNARYPAKRMYQGEVDDYMLLDHTLFSTQFLFNLYAY